MYKPTEIREFMHTSVKQLSIFRELGIVLIASFMIHSPLKAAMVVEALDHIESSVLRFVEEQYPRGDDLQVRVGQLDRRLRLSRCSNALETTWAPGSATLGQTTVAVRCQGVRPWKLYVPVKVALQQNVAVTSRPMIRGERIRRGDLIIEKRALGRQRGIAIRNPEQVQGYLIKTNTSAGQVGLARMLSAPKLVERGQRVMLSALRAGWNINMHGIALEDGRRGETIKVRNPVSQRVLEGIVIAPGQVQTRAP